MSLVTLNVQLGDEEGFFEHILLCISEASLMTQMVKKPSATRETWVRSLGWEDPLKEGTATHFSLLPGESPWTEESGGLHTVYGVEKSRYE